MVFEAHLLTGCIAISSLALNMFKLIPGNLHCFQLNVVFRRVLCQGHFYFLYTLMTFFYALIISHSSFLQTTLIFSSNTKNISELTKIVNHKLSFVATWFKANKLNLHPDKTKFTLFHPARKKINPAVFLLTLIRTVLIEQNTQNSQVLSSIKTSHSRLI